MNALVIAAIALILLSRDGRLDFYLARLAFDLPSGTFPLRDVPLLAVYGHAWLKNLTTLAWLLCMPIALASVWLRHLHGWRTALFKFILYAGMAAWAIQSLKAASPHACPWDLAEFGGSASWFPLLDNVSLSADGGHCWPGGHASAGFALVAGWFAARDTHPRIAAIMLWLGLAMGSLMGTIQMLRGAHFLTHNLWSLWIVWAVCLGMEMLWQLSTYALQAFRKRSQAASETPALPQWIPAPESHCDAGSVQSAQ
ncbi:phosphatase PAP2 family protein [uncultured Oxalicibacterium sp.]|uniref:phosphatase PAP2 family protein n=1 Tax=uncultured Oxalicibacterium sp. TaxID=1168540 RepID=UPI0025ED8744|nr:phosphatase PAP2 family protein [uncultured Oxalicibacterium sp.]